jgi:hypothetical protein
VSESAPHYDAPIGARDQFNFLLLHRNVRPKRLPIHIGSAGERARPPVQSFFVLDQMNRTEPNVSTHESHTANLFRTLSCFYARTWCRARTHARDISLHVPSLDCTHPIHSRVKSIPRTCICSNSDTSYVAQRISRCS